MEQFSKAHGRSPKHSFQGNSNKFDPNRKKIIIKKHSSLKNERKISKHDFQGYKIKVQEK